MLYPQIESIINALDVSSISEERQRTLQPLINYIKSKVEHGREIRLNFICTHNSRRSYFSQVWAQAMAYHYKIEKAFCYSGGTEASALFPMVATTLVNTGFKIEAISDGKNPVYKIKYAANEHPIIGFSKAYNSNFNPETGFAAIMTCSQADGNCPVIKGADKRIPITFEDPKASDGTLQQKAVYNERSLQIATEMKYIFSNLSCDRPKKKWASAQE